MLEHFGIKDIWTVIKKNKYVIVLCMVSCLILFGFITYAKLKNLNENHQEGQPLYASSLSYYVKPNILNIESEKVEAEIYRSLPSDYVALLNTDSCAFFVYENLIKMYSLEYLKKNSELNIEDLKDVPLIQSVKEIYKVKRYNSTMVFNIYALAYNEELSKSILNLLREYLEKNIESKIKDASLELSGEAVKMVNSSKDLEDDEASSSVISKSSNAKAIIKAVIKNIIIPLVFVMMLLLFILVSKAFLNPTLNRKSDFAAYDIPIIGEIKEN